MDLLLFACRMALNCTYTHTHTILYSRSRASKRAELNRNTYMTDKLHILIMLTRGPTTAVSSPPPSFPPPSIVRIPMQTCSYIPIHTRTHIYTNSHKGTNNSVNDNRQKESKKREWCFVIRLCTIPIWSISTCAFGQRGKRLYAILFTERG